MNPSASTYGVCLNRQACGVIIVPTVRSDLHWDRYRHQCEHNASIENLVDRQGEFRPVTPPTLFALFDLESAVAAATVAATLNQFWKGHGREKADRVILSQADAEFTVEHVATCWGLTPRTLGEATSRDVAEWGPHDVVDFDDVPDPSMSPAEYWHRLAQGEDIEQFTTIVAPVNLTTLIGGLARIPRRKEVQEKAAKEYRSLYDRAILMGNPKAIDYGSAVQVDNSRNAFFATGALDDASERYKRAVRALGMLRSAVVDPIVLQDQTVSAVARRRYGNAGGQARKKVEKELKEGLDILAVHFELIGTSTRSAKVTGWYEERLPLELPTETA